MHMAGIVLRGTLSFFKFIAVYLTLGLLGIFVIVFCSGLTESICSGTSLRDCVTQAMQSDPISVIDAFKSRIVTEVPFGEILEKMMEDSGGYIEIVLNFKSGEVIPFELLRENLFRDIVNITVANFIIYLFCRINAALSTVFSGFAFSLGLNIAMGIFGVAGFSISANILTLVSFYAKSYTVPAYVVLAVVFFVLHASCLTGMRIKIPLFSTVKYLGTDLIKGVVNSILVWALCSNLQGIYRSEQMGAFLIAFALFSFALMLEKELC